MTTRNFTWNQCEAIARQGLKKLPEDFYPDSIVSADWDGLFLSTIATHQYQDSFWELDSDASRVLIVGGLYSKGTISDTIEDLEHVCDVDECHVLCMVGPPDTPNDVYLGYVNTEGSGVTFPWG